MVAFTTNSGTAVAASQLDSQQRQQLAVSALAGDSISALARQNEVSRKFIYQQKEQAQQALQDSFTPSPATEKVLFYLPVTEKWLYSLVLGLLLTCRSSFRGIQELLADHFGFSISLGTIHNLSARAVEQARAIIEANAEKLKPETVENAIRVAVSIIKEKEDTKVDFLAEILGLHRSQVVHIIQVFRETKIL